MFEGTYLARSPPQVPEFVMELLVCFATHYQYAEHTNIAKRMQYLGEVKNSQKFAVPYYVIYSEYF